MKRSRINFRQQRSLRSWMGCHWHWIKQALISERQNAVSLDTSISIVLAARNCYCGEAHYQVTILNLWLQPGRSLSSKLSGIALLLIYYVCLPFSIPKVYPRKLLPKVQSNLVPYLARLQSIV